MPIDSSVAELITAQLFVLSQEAPDPIYFYINSTGIAVRGLGGPRCRSCLFTRQLRSLAVHAAAAQRLLRACMPPQACMRISYKHEQKSTTKYGNEHEAIAVYCMMRAVQKYCPIYTLCVGNAFGEAALLLSAGTKVRRRVRGRSHDRWLLAARAAACFRGSGPVLTDANPRVCHAATHRASARRCARRRS